MEKLKVRSDGLTIVLAPAETADAIDDAVLDHLLEVMAVESGVGFDLAGSPAALLCCEQVEILRHPSNPMVWLVAEGEEDDVRWVMNKVLVDGWADLGCTLELPAGELVVRDAMGRGRETLSDLPAGTYRLLECRADSALVWLLAEKRFWDRFE